MDMNMHTCTRAWATDEECCRPLLRAKVQSINQSHRTELLNITVSTPGWSALASAFHCELADSPLLMRPRVAQMLREVPEPKAILSDICEVSTPMLSTESLGEHVGHILRITCSFHHSSFLATAQYCALTPVKRDAQRHVSVDGGLQLGSDATIDSSCWAHLLDLDCFLGTGPRLERATAPIRHAKCVALDSLRFAVRIPGNVSHPVPIAGLGRCHVPAQILRSKLKICAAHREIRTATPDTSSSPGQSLVPPSSTER